MPVKITRGQVAWAMSAIALVTLVIVSPDAPEPTPPPQQLLTTSIGPRPDDCFLNVQFQPPDALFRPDKGYDPPFRARPFSHLTMKVNGLDYGRRSFVAVDGRKLDGLWRVEVPVECGIDKKDIAIVIQFWPKAKGEEVEPWIAIAVKKVEVKGR